MPKPNQSSKPFLVFPENSASIIADILKRYKLKESNKELLEKWRRGERGRGEILADLLIKMVETNLSISELADLAKKELNISSQWAKKIISDLTNRILTPALQLSEKTFSGKEPPPEQRPKEIPETPKPKTKDVYRETIE